MNFIIIIAILITGLITYIIWEFIKYRNKNKLFENEVYSHINNGLSLEDALKLSFIRLNNSQNFGLSDSTIIKVCDKIVDLEKRMNTENVVEIYSSFINRYIYKSGKITNPKNISDKKIIYAIENLNLHNGNGYFVIWNDKPEDLNKKHSTENKKIKGQEIKEALEILDSATNKFGPTFNIVKEQIKKDINSDTKQFLDVVQGGRTVRKYIYSQISNISGDLVESGHYHIYRGVLNPMGPGKELLKIFDIATDELVKLGDHDEKYAKEQKETIRENIKSMG
jgi:hypothetical protein